MMTDRLVVVEKRPTRAVSCSKLFRVSHLLNRVNGSSHYFQLWRTATHNRQPATLPTSAVSILLVSCVRGSASNDDLPVWHCDTRDPPVVAPRNPQCQGPTHTHRAQGTSVSRCAYISLIVRTRKPSTSTCTKPFGLSPRVSSSSSHIRGLRCGLATHSLFSPAATHRVFLIISFASVRP